MLLKADTRDKKLENNFLNNLHKRLETDVFLDEAIGEE